MVADPLSREDLTLESARIAERALIGALLNDRDAVAVVADWLKPGAFSDHRCKELYEAILVCWQARIPPDPVTISHGLGMNGIEPASVDWADVVEMMLECPLGCHAEYYARLVVDAAKRRLVAELGQQMVRGAYGGRDFDYETAYRAALEEIETLAPSADKGPVPYSELIPDYQEYILRSWNGEIERREVPTGFRRLDVVMRGGWRPGELIVVAARPGMGKTAWALQVAHNVARKTSHRVIIFTAEMSIESLLERSLAEVSGVAPEVAETGHTTDRIRDAILAATERLADLPVSLDDTSAITTNQMIHRVQRLQRREPVALVVFDYLELAGDTTGENETIRVGEITRQMKHLAMTCGLPVMLLCQLNRNVEHRTSKMPNLSDLRQSGAIEQHADKVLFLFREDYYVGQEQLQPTPGKEGTCDVIIGKQRNGKTGTFPLRFYPETMTFSELDEDRRFQA